MASSSSGTRNCVGCGRAIAWDANVCPYCGHDFRVQMAPPKKEKSGLPIAGGVLIIIASLMYFAIGGIIAAGSTLALFGTLGASSIGILCGVVIIVLGIVALLGGAFAVMRKHFGLAVLGGVLVIPSILGLIGLILVAVSHDSFD